MNNSILRTDRDQLTVEDVAHYLRVDAHTVTRWLDNADLPGYRLPTRWLIMSDD
ncbi:helix-turn-helix domain-containing protein [Ornithinimicrobium murale]|uniref:helix-turn-helix domain-containing protein n=1 Tax=Ornithinimicrobium murale TaxID=1050153 RepID=UPI000E0DC58F|nr:helix-turn-helix domain-containing protein [Ornithinimicrobium murale]